MTNPFTSKGSTILLAHRGLHTRERENTIASFRAALEAGADGVELDVHLTKDGRLAVIHDSNTSRTAGISLDVESSTLEELRAADEEIPTLEDVFQAFPDILYDIELKCPMLRPDGMEVQLTSSHD